jgi:hypothetical protein
MATKKTAYVDVNFVITVRVPVEADLLPEHSEVGDDVESNISDNLWNKLVSTACDCMEGPDGNNVESIVVAEIESDDDDPEDEGMFDDCPEYVHDAAIDWLYDHATEYDDRDEAMGACKADLAEEGYHIYENSECEWAVEDAFDDYDGENGWD